MHFCFIPVVIDKNKNIEKVSAKELITRSYLQTFHNRLSDHINKSFNREIGVLNGATANGNKTVLEMKNEQLEEELNEISNKTKEYNITLEKIENLKISDTIFGNVKGISTKKIEALINEGSQSLKIKKELNTLKSKNECLKRELDIKTSENERLESELERLQNNLQLEKEKHKEARETLEYIPEELKEKIKQEKMFNNICKNINQKNNNELYQKLVMETNMPKDELVSLFKDEKLFADKDGNAVFPTVTTDENQKIIGILKVNLNRKTGVIGEITKIGDVELSSEQTSLASKIQRNYNYTLNKEVELGQER